MDTNRIIETLEEKIPQQATLATSVLTEATEHADQLDRRNDITAAARGAAIAGVGDLSYGFLRYATNVVMTHMVSPATYGVFGEVYTAAIILAWATKLGLDGVFIRLLPTYRVKGERALLAGLVRFSTWTTLLSGLLAGLFIFFFTSFIAIHIYHDLAYRLPLQEIAPLIPLMSLQVVLACGLQGFKEIKWKVYMDRLCQPLITLMTMVIFYWLGWRLEALSFSAIAGFCCSVLLGQLVFGKVVKRFTRSTPPRYIPLVWSSSAIPLLCTGLVQSLLNSADILFLSLFSTPSQAGIYIAADRVSYFVVMPLFAFNMIFSPMMGEYHAGGKYERLASMFKMVTKWSFSLSLPIFLCCLVFRDSILGVFGPQYTSAALVLILLCFGNLVDAGTGSVLQLLTMTGHLRIILLNSIISVTVSIGLSLVLIQRYGILGAALAAIFAVIVINGLGLIEMYWITKIHPYRSDIYKPLLAGGAASIVGVLLLHFIHFSNIRFATIEKLSLIIPFVLVYVLVMILLRFNEEDRIVFDVVRIRLGRARSPLRTL